MVAQVGDAAAGVVLVGGRSSRMGTPKAALEWRGSTLLGRTLGVLRRVVDGPLLVVRAPGQQLPGVAPWVRVVEDPQEGLGPLQGIATALVALNELTGQTQTGQTQTGKPPTGRIQTGETKVRSAPTEDQAAVRGVEAAFICSTDLPFLHPTFVQRILAALTDDVDVVLPVARGYPQPLAAAYRPTLASLAVELVAAGNLRPAFLFGHRHCRTLRLDDAALLADSTLAAVDPALDSVINVNTPDDYHTVRCQPEPEVTVQRCGSPIADGPPGPRTVRAATLAAAAKAIALTLDRHVAVLLNGAQISYSGDIPLFNGDLVTFHRQTSANEPVTG